jgi:hypothetical protein
LCRFYRDFRRSGLVFVRGGVFVVRGNSSDSTETPLLACLARFSSPQAIPLAAAIQL